VQLAVDFPAAQLFEKRVIFLLFAFRFPCDVHSSYLHSLLTVLATIE
jgi:hypothetical protein